MHIQDLQKFYITLDSQFNVTNNELTNATYSKVDSNFVYSAKYARHRWFNYKEGFSPVLVDKIFNENKLTSKAIVCDPFCGAGTTLAVAKACGMQSIGFEVNPFAAFITKVKTNNYLDSDKELVLSYLYQLENISLDTNIELPQNDYLCRIFSHDMLIAELNIRAFLRSLPVCNANDLLYFAWLCTLENASLYRKAGNGLKLKTKPPVYDDAFSFALGLIKNKLDAIIEDFSISNNGPVPKVIVDSATTMPESINEESVDLVLFSPPYANCFDYTKIYYLELWFGGFIDSAKEQKDIRMKSIRSHCHATWPARYQDFYLPELNDDLLPLLRQQKLWTSRIPDMLNGYFADMAETLRLIYKSLKKGGCCDIVVSNSAYAGIIIPTDVLLAKIACQLGFSVKEIQVERLIITSSQQYKKTESIRKYLRESIVKLEK